MAGMSDYVIMVKKQVITSNNPPLALYSPRPLLQTSAVGETAANPPPHSPGAAGPGGLETRIHGDHGRVDGRGAGRRRDALQNLGLLPPVPVVPLPPHRSALPTPSLKKRAALVRQRWRKIQRVFPPGHRVCPISWPTMRRTPSLAAGTLGRVCVLCVYGVCERCGGGGHNLK